MIRNFMSLTFARKARIQLQQRKNRDIYKVTFIDNTALSYNNAVVDHETEDTQLQIRSHI